MARLSILIPARNERFLSNTIQDILAHAEGDTEVIAGLDGYWPDPPVEDHPRVKLFHVAESIGQRAMTNQLARLSQAEYLMKADAHCAFDQGFDLKLMGHMQPHYTLVPMMRNLHAFDWVCPAGHRRYQGPSGPCQAKVRAADGSETVCGQPTSMDVVWIAKTNPTSTAYRFDKTMHFQYWNEYGRAQKGEVTDSLSIQGSCFLVTRDKYWELGLCSEEFGSWGQQGVEVACKTWLSGGEVKVDRTTWYAHMFRTQGGDFSFPYPNPGQEVERNRELSRQLFPRDGWAGAIHPFQWLIDKFQPPEWTATPARGGRPPTRGILYYSDNRPPAKVLQACQRQIAAVAHLPITSVTLKPMDFGRNIVLDRPRGYETMFRQILTGLEAMEEDIVYFAEHDVFYHPNHFAFCPERDDTYYYNGNFWFLRLADGYAVHYNVNPLAGLVAYRPALLTHFRERMQLIEREGFSYRIGFEPFTHHRIPWPTWFSYKVFEPEYPNVDLCHEANATWKRFSPDQFRRKPRFWEVGDAASIPGWPDLPERVAALREVT